MQVGSKNASPPRNKPRLEQECEGDGHHLRYSICEIRVKGQINGVVCQLVAFGEKTPTSKISDVLILAEGRAKLGWLSFVHEVSLRIIIKRLARLDSDSGIRRRGGSRD